MEEAAESNVDELVVEFEETYGVVHHHHTNKNYRPNPKHRAKWRWLAEQCLAMGFDGRRFIKWAYSYYRVTRPEVYVNMIVSPKTIRLYCDRHSSARKADTVNDVRFGVMIRLQLHTLKVEMEAGRPVEDIISDPSLELGVVFRYAIALCAECRELVDRFRVEAEREMRMDHRYQQALAAFWPTSENEEHAGSP